jgi:hypothetical protein
MVHRGLGALLAGGVTMSGGSRARVDQLRTVTSAEVAITSSELSINVSVSAVTCGILQRAEPHCMVGLHGGEITGRGLSSIDASPRSRGHGPRPRPPARRGVTVSASRTALRPA